MAEISAGERSEHTNVTHASKQIQLSNGRFHLAYLMNRYSGSQGSLMIWLDVKLILFDLAHLLGFISQENDKIQPIQAVARGSTSQKHPDSYWSKVRI